MGGEKKGERERREAGGKGEVGIWKEKETIERAGKEDRTRDNNILNKHDVQLSIRGITPG